MLEVSISIDGTCQKRITLVRCGNIIQTQVLQQNEYNGVFTLDSRKIQYDARETPTEVQALKNIFGIEV